MKLFLAIILIGWTGAALAVDTDPELREVLRAAASESPSFADRFEAEVWLTDMSSRLARQVRDPEERIEILTLVHMEAKRQDDRTLPGPGGLRAGGPHVYLLRPAAGTHTRGHRGRK